MNEIGIFEFQLVDKTTGEELERKLIKNTLTKVNQDIRSQMLMGTYTGGNDALQIKYIAIGDDNTPATINDTALGLETFRKQITQITSPSDGTVKSVVSLSANEGNQTIKEIGIFGGAGATLTPDSGTLLARVVVNIVKNSNTVLNIVRTDICTLN